MHPDADKDSYHFEKQLWEEGFRSVMGLDEVGRGCLAGPVVASGVIFPPFHRVSGIIADSKKLNPSERIRIAEIIKREAKCWTISWCDVDEIKTYNILQASLRAMEKCVKKAEVSPDYLLIDGNKGLDSSLIPSKTVIKGDDRSVSIGAASILAKVFRDRLMSELHEQYPEFGWNQNVGYPTSAHYEALQRFGFTPFHRTTFNLRTNQSYDRHRIEI